MSWIEAIGPETAQGRLKKLYERIAGPGGQVDNILRAHSLRPHTLEGHMALYKAVLHHFGNRLDKAYLETLGVWVSQLNGCDYCVEHHFEGLKRLLKDDARAQDIREAFEAGEPERVFAGREREGLRYARALTETPADISASDVEALRQAGFDDGEILEINQVSAYFAYANRTVLGLGVDPAGETLGLSPGDSSKPDDWGHG